MFLRFGLTNVLLATAVVAAQAQVNIDQGKSAAQIFANDCAACHKATRGLANGKNSLTLASFLREHYTASREQAAALAAYVLGAGGSEPAKPGQKPGSEHAKVEEPKTVEPRAAEPRIPEPRSTEPKEPRSTEPKTAAHSPPEMARPESETPAGAASPPPQVAEPSAAVVPPAAEPAVANSAASPDMAPTTSAAAPAETAPGEAEPVPRDNIPD